MWRKLDGAVNDRGRMPLAENLHLELRPRLLGDETARRDAEALELMLSDRQLLDAMAESTNLGRVLRDYDGDVLQTMTNLGYETFVIALARAAQARRKTLFTPAAVEQVWATATL